MPNINFYIQKYGENALSFCSKQPKVSFFYYLNGVISYLNSFGFYISVLGDPICSKEELKEILKNFIKKYPQATFFQINVSTAKVLSELGYKHHVMGVENIIELKSFNPTWKTHRSFKRHCNLADKENVVVKESYLHRELIKKVEKLSHRWLKTRPSSSDNQSFLTRPLVLESEKGCRYFFAYCDNKLGDNKLVGIRFYYPMYKNNKVIGYYNDICRIDPIAPSGTSYRLAAYAMETFKREGIQFLSLGLSPFYNIKRPQSIIETIFSTCYKYGDFIYNFYGISHHKSRFHPQTHPVYFSSRYHLPLLSLYFGLAHTIGQFLIFLKPTFLYVAIRVFISVFIYLSKRFFYWIDRQCHFVVVFLRLERWQSGRMRRS